ncbi:MAG: SulP family inorganic anion transporter [Pseudomonadales bacterium]|jgi:SulP family sulfate permease|nr:SulP family inorganic anion transporter [Pseudomonadales bacterium]
MFSTEHLRGDLYGGLTAAIVALPLALAFGVASGAGAIAGLYGAIAVGFFAAAFGGTPTNVSGPTGPMVVVFAGLAAAFADQPALIFTAVVLAGALQILFGVLGLGTYIRLVPYPVISGFMSGIGCIIIILQAAGLFGHDAPPGTLDALASIPRALRDINPSAAGLGALSLVIVFAWPRRLVAIFPGPLAALVAGTLIGLFLPAAPKIGAIPSGLPGFVMPTLDALSSVVVIKAAVVLAVLGALDSLLTSLVADNMTRTRHDSNRELVGQGIGNLVAGFIGGVPGAGATMRTVVNIRTGGRTRLSGMLHSLVLLAIVLALGPLAERIPHAVLAGILFKVGFDIIDWTYLRRSHRGPRIDLALMTIVLLMTVFVDLMTAVIVGVFLAALAFIQQLAESQIRRLRSSEVVPESERERSLLEQAEGRINIFEFNGPMSFAAAADLGHHVRDTMTPHQQALILDFREVPFLDLSAARAVETVAIDARDAGRDVYVCGLSDAGRRTLAELGADQAIVRDGFLSDRESAIALALERLAPRVSGAAARRS